MGSRARAWVCRARACRGLGSVVSALPRLGFGPAPSLCLPSRLRPVSCSLLAPAVSFSALPVPSGPWPCLSRARRGRGGPAVRPPSLWAPRGVASPWASPEPAGDDGGINRGGAAFVLVGGRGRVGGRRGNRFSDPLGPLWLPVACPGLLLGLYPLGRHAPAWLPGIPSACSGLGRLPLSGLVEGHHTPGWARGPLPVPKVRGLCGRVVSWHRP